MRFSLGLRVDPLFNGQDVHLLRQIDCADSLSRAFLESVAIRIERLLEAAGPADGDKPEMERLLSELYVEITFLRAEIENLREALGR